MNALAPLDHFIVSISKDASIDAMKTRIATCGGSVYLVGTSCRHVNMLYTRGLTRESARTLESTSVAVIPNSQDPMATPD